MTATATSRVGDRQTHEGERGWGFFFLFFFCLVLFVFFCFFLLLSKIKQQLPR